MSATDKQTQRNAACHSLFNGTYCHGTRIDVSSAVKSWHFERPGSLELSLIIRRGCKLPTALAYLATEDLYQFWHVMNITEQK